jgi:hypothetical protein
MPWGTVLDDYMVWMEKHGRDYDHFHVSYDEIYSKHINKFVAVKNLKVCHDCNPLKLLELLRRMVLMTLTILL